MLETAAPEKCSLAAADDGIVVVDMEVTIDIDDAVMAEAQQVSGAATQREAVEEGLRLLIQIRRQAGIRGLRNKVRWEGDLDASRSSTPFP
jgi:Arc/MetJ family transcription regulator